MVKAGKTREYERVGHPPPDSIDPTGFWRFVFWLALVLGTLSLLLAWGFAYVPKPDFHGDYRPDYIVRSCSAVLMLVSILMARWLWGIKNPFVDERPITPMRFVLCFAWVEAVIAVIGIIGLTFHR
jgi:hypothetical protein